MSFHHIFILVYSFEITKNCQIKKLPKNDKIVERENYLKKLKWSKDKIV